MLQQRHKLQNSPTQIINLCSSTIATPLGNMIALADEHALYLLEFHDRKNLAAELLKLEQRAVITPGTTPVLTLVKQELQAYFSGKLTQFQTPIKLAGSDFQNLVWQKLRTISYGQTYSYKDIAQKLNKPTAFRAVARANSANQLAIVVPCHRVINSGGSLGGYSAGLERKQWLLEHERNNNHPLDPRCPITVHGDKLILEPADRKEDIHWLDRPENAHLKEELKIGIEQAVKGKVVRWDDLKAELSDDLKSELGM